MQATKLIGPTSNILDLFTYDLTTFFYIDDYEIVDSVEKDGVLMVEYEKNLPWTELNLFDSVVFRVFTEKASINSGSHVNVKFTATPEKENQANFETLLSQLVKIYGNDNQHLALLTDNEKKQFNTQTIERQWTIGTGKKVYTIVLRKPVNEPILLSILFFNHLASFIS